MDLSDLEAAKRSFGTADPRRLPRLLEILGRRRFRNAEEIIRFHEALLFFRAYPPGAAVARLADELLEGIPERVERLRRAGADLTPLEEPEVSGIAGTAFSAIFTYDMTRWLAEHHPREVEIDWDGYNAELLGPLLRRLHPFYGEDALVEANIPYLDWLRAAKKGRGSDLRWLISRVERLPVRAEDRAELWAGAKLPVRWELGNSPTSRTHLRLPGKRKMFYHPGPLLRRADVSLAQELETPPFRLERLSRAQGQRILDLARETSAMRYRELHGFTYGDPDYVFRVDFGRGVETYVWGVPAAHRLPLRAYHCGIYFKNGVPIGYVEVLTLFEHMEVGFNLYYTFREGETAWLYARLLRLFRQMLNVTCFAVDPYQIGRHNEEAIESGAFWFYRKLGFRPADTRVANLLAKEEAKLAANPAYRTPARTLEKLAGGWVIYEAPGTRQGDWDRFEVRRAAMALDRTPFPAKVRQAKNAAQESRYARALQSDPGLRRAILKLGSRPALG